jgi:hypothetical protein
MINFDSIFKQRKIILLILASFVLLEAFSFLSYYFSVINLIIFSFVVLLALFLAIYKIEWSFYILLAELFSNSMGYIFYLESGGFKLSLRIALWLVIIAVWLAKFLLEIFNNKKEVWLRYKKIPYFRNWLYLFLFIALGLIVGIIKNGFSDAFFDFNAWLYFALIFPLWHIVSDNNKDVFVKNVVSIFLGAILFLIFKSFLFLFLFSHSLEPLIADLYYWTRRYYLGEITAMSGGFYRVFLQSQIYILIALLISISAWVFTKNKKAKIYLLAFLSLLSSVLILSFSRSFWLAGILALALLFVVLWSKFGFRRMFNSFLVTLFSFIIGFSLVLGVVKFPWPNSEVKFNLDSLSERANVRVEESAISSRWALLDILRSDISNNFLLGRGFGARVEYKSSDPRVLEQTADGVYSTYAFEWGWLDIWLKLGFLGILAYGLLIYLFIKDFWQKFKREDNFIYLGLILSVASLVVVNFFTPYLNHPLGIGFLLVITLFWSKNIFKSSENER